jgi:hypothetical protein
MANNDDQWIADVTTYIRNSFGNKAPLVTRQTVAALRKEHGNRSTAWTQEELEALEPPVLPYASDWKLTASNNAGELTQAFDGDSSSRYTTGKSMANGMWVQIEFPAMTRVSSLILDTRGSSGDYPRGYKVQVSEDGKSWSAPVAKGKGRSALTEIKFKPVNTKFVRITQTGRNGLYWSIHEMKVMGKKL